MQKEKSCGAVVYRKAGAETLFLLERMVQGHTSLPKGHVEGDETEEETARREIREETGLEVELCTAFRRQITYAPRPGVTKDVVFFLAEALPGEAVNQECEVSGIEWLPFEEALAELTYDSDRDVLTGAKEWLAKTDEEREASGEPRERAAAPVRLEEVTPENWRADLHVREDQQRFVASREGTLARAFAYRERRSRAFIIMAGDEPVGMAMYYDSPHRDSYAFSEFFIDERYQGRGFGRAAAELVLERMRADGRYARVLLCYVDGNDVAKRLYESLGFHCTGEADGDEIVMELIFPEDAKELPLRPAFLSDAPRESGDGRVGITPVGNTDSGEVHIGRKIIVVGSSGSGKSTFARRLHECTGLPLTHLDLLWWRPDATNVPREEFDRALDEVLRRDEWIIDGLYTRTLETRLLACDTVIFLDLPEVECLRGIEQRVGTKRPDIPWVEERVEPELVELVRDFHARKRGMLLELLAQHPEKQVLTFTSRADADAWLKSVHFWHNMRTK